MQCQPSLIFGANRVDKEIAFKELNGIRSDERSTNHKDKENIEFSCERWCHGLKLNIDFVSDMVFKPECAEGDSD